MDQKSLMDITQEYPRLLDTPGMIAQDFGILYPHAKDKLFELWGHASQRILSYCKTEKRALDLLPLQTNISSDTLGDVALKTLPAILPPLPYKIGSKMVRPSYQEAKEAFVDLQPVGTNIIQYLEEEEQRRQFPHVLQLGDKVNCSQAFVIVGGVALEQDSLLQAVDTCFKLFYVLDIEYPKPAAAVWQFLQHTIYSVPGGVPSTHCRLLRQFIIG
ncbi:uncharacterized protein LOC131543811 isoform X2 [Onychostoma macrolepis]|uniref:uncharacterized protein LOC131543811 isoform X2 n=1 Tax=Onychostoma macrolepis TaxID=369639 RepID=UPI00272A53B7|nr:uncharacterized protein LOC131543811 isoform X2 [Onychostoma macrolepis]